MDTRASVRNSLLTVSLFIASTFAYAAAYDPLAIDANRSVQTMDFTITDVARQRDIPIRVFVPEKKHGVPVILFSHGLGGSREGSAYLGNHWSARGYVVVFLQHAGSDVSVWKDASLGQRRGALRKAANLDNFQLRVQDVTAVLDQLEQWNRLGRHPLAGIMDLTKVGMSGHSFGAVTTQAVSGQSFGRGGRSLREKRIQAALAFSPSGPRSGDPAAAFGSVDIPWMLMIGTNDVAAIGDIDVALRRSVFPALPADSKYELVLKDAEHSAFSDRALPGESKPRNPNHHRVILALSTAFWDAWLQDNAAAKAWLDGKGPDSVLQKGDIWQRK